MWFDEAGQYGLIDGKAPGKTPSLNEHRSKALTDIVERGAYPFADWVVHLRLVDLQTWILEEFGITVSETLISRWLNLLSFCKPTAPPPSPASALMMAMSSPSSIPRLSEALQIKFQD
ncbi:MAG: hypothetical protein GC205_13305 [Bacteroidetes bacterium]|nr:hypothetical protein [Bacteroidota bacterium]